MKKYLEYTDAKSNKYWEIEVVDKTYTVTYGKVGTDGRTSTKEFGSNEKALVEAKKIIAKKEKKGYSEPTKEVETKAKEVKAEEVKAKVKETKAKEVKVTPKPEEVKVTPKPNKTRRPYTLYGLEKVLIRSKDEISFLTFSGGNHLTTYYKNKIKKAHWFESKIPKTSWKEIVCGYNASQDEMVFVTKDVAFTTIASKWGKKWENPIPPSPSSRFVFPLGGNDILDGHFYAVSYNRSVFRREGPNQWTVLDNGFPNLDFDDQIMFRGIGGFSDSDLYAGGDDGDLWHWDGTSWTEVNTKLDIKTQTIDKILCAGDGNIYVGFLHGGIIKMSNGKWEKIDTSIMSGGYDAVPEIVWFKDRVYVTHQYGEFYEIQDKKLIQSHLSEKLNQKVKHIDAKDGILVIAGNKNINIYDGNDLTILYEDVEEEEKVEDYDIFSLLNDSDIEIRRLALIEFTANIDAKNIDIANQNIWLSGSVELYKNTELKESLKALNSKLTTRRTKDTTLLVVGLKTKVKELPKDIPAISGLHLQNLIQENSSNTLAESTNENIEQKLNDLLASQDKANINIAIDLMKGGGIPEKVTSLLFGLFKVYPDKNIRAAISKLFKLRGNKTSAQLMSICGRRNYLSMEYDDKPKKDINLMLQIKGFNIEPFLYCIASYQGIGTYALTGLDSDWAERYILNRFENKKEVTIYSNPGVRFKKLKNVKEITLAFLTEDADLSPLAYIENLETIHIYRCKKSSITIPKDLSNLKTFKVTDPLKKVTLDAKISVDSFDLKTKNLVVTDNFQLDAKEVVVTCQSNCNLAPFISKKTETLNFIAKNIKIDEVKNSITSFNVETTGIDIDHTKQIFPYIDDLNIDIQKDLKGLKPFMSTNLKKILIKCGKELTVDDSILESSFELVSLTAKSLVIDYSKPVIQSKQIELNIAGNIDNLKPFLSKKLKTINIVSNGTIIIDKALNGYAFPELSIIGKNLHFKTNDLVLEMDKATLKGKLKCDGIVKSTIKELIVSHMDDNLLSKTMEKITLDIPLKTDMTVSVTNIHKLTDFKIKCASYKSSSVHLSGDSLSVDQLTINQLELKFDESLTFDINRLRINTQKDFIFPIKNFPKLEVLDFEGLDKHSSIKIQGEGKYPSLKKLFLEDVKLEMDPSVDLVELEEIAFDDVTFTEEVRNQVTKDSLKKILTSMYEKDFEFELTNHPNIYELDLSMIRNVKPAIYPVKKVGLRYREIKAIKPEHFPNLETFVNMYVRSESFADLIPFKKLKVLETMTSTYTNKKLNDIEKLESLEKLKLFSTYISYGSHETFPLPLFKKPLKIKQFELQKLYLEINSPRHPYFECLEELILDDALVQNISVFKVPSLKKITIKNWPSVQRPKNWLEDIKKIFTGIEIVVPETDK